MKGYFQKPVLSETDLKYLTLVQHIALDLVGDFILLQTYRLKHLVTYFPQVFHIFDALFDNTTIVSPFSTLAEFYPACLPWSLLHIRGSGGDYDPLQIRSTSEVSKIS